VAIPRFAKVAAWAELRARTDGLRGSSSAWMAIWVLLTGYRYLKRKAAPDPVVVRERLEPGQQLIVTHFAEGAAPADPVASRRRRSRR
jgi:hypothetical protein